MNFDNWLAANGYDAEHLTAAQRKHLEAAYKAEVSPAPVPAPAPAPAPTPAAAPTQSLDDVVAAGRREQERVGRITEMVAETIQTKPGLIDQAEAIGRQAIEGKWDCQKAELELLRLRGNGGQVFLNTRGKPAVTSEVLEAALCSSGRLGGLSSHFSEETLDAAHRHFKGGVGLTEAIVHVARANGYRGHGNKGDLAAVLRAAFSQPRGDGASLMAVGPSTLDISGILSNTANKFLRVSFLAVEQAWREIAAIRSVSDFKTVTSYSLTGDNTYQQVAAGGELKHGTLGETSYTNQADTYGRLLGLDRRDLINDDLGALTGAGRRLGRGGALKLNDVFWTAWLDDSAFFPTNKSKNNYDDGATDSVLSLAGLENADNIFRAQTDPDGKPLGSLPAILLVPTTLRATALNLMSDAITAAAQSTATLTVQNVWAGMFKVVSSLYLSSTAITGYSATAWYLLADPNDLPAIEVAFLNGVEMPTVETADLEFNRLGIALRGYFDFGVSKQEYRAGVKLKGAA